MRFFLIWSLLALLVWTPAGAAPVLEQKVLGNKDGITETKLFYEVDGLRLQARVFAPLGDKPLPGVVYAHDGNSGLSHSSVSRCLELAHFGYVVIAPSYRGEDGSEGEVEIAAGEVHDVLGAADVLQHWPHVDANRMAAIGTSHGALIVMLAAERSHVFKAVVEGYGVMDIIAWWHYLKDAHLSTDDPLSRRVYGRGPQDRPEAFQSREVVTHVDQLEAPVLIVQGGQDKTVPPNQADRLEHALQQAGKRYQVLRYPTEEHGFLIYPGDAASNRNRETAWGKIRAFLEQTL